MKATAQQWYTTIGALSLDRQWPLPAGPSAGPIMVQESGFGEYVVRSTERVFAEHKRLHLGGFVLGPRSLASDPFPLEVIMDFASSKRTTAQGVWPKRHRRAAGHRFCQRDLSDRLYRRRQLSARPPRRRNGAQRPAVYHPVAGRVSGRGPQYPPAGSGHVAGRRAGGAGGKDRPAGHRGRLDDRRIAGADRREAAESGTRDHLRPGRKAAADQGQR